MNWQEWIVWGIFAVVVVSVWRWVWRTFMCRTHRCEHCIYGHCGIRDKEWEQEHDKRTKR